MSTSKRKFLAGIVFSFVVAFGVFVSTVLSNWYPVSPTIQPTFIAQQSGNWCGPTVVQSAIQWDPLTNSRDIGRN